MFTPFILAVLFQLPITVHATWVPSLVDSTHSAPLQYSIVTDGGTPVIAPVSACTSSLCTFPISVSSFGQHTTIVNAEYLLIDQDPTSVTDVPSVADNWKLNNGSNSVTNTKIIK